MNGINHYYSLLLIILLHFHYHIGRHIMSLEHPSAHGESSDFYDPLDVASHNGYYYVCTSLGAILVSWFIDLYCGFH
jgi:hypothetical protein